MEFCPVKHAKSYPFHIPEGSYVLDRDGWRPVEGTPPVKNRHAVIASGSNASPQRLAAKFAGHPHLLDETIPVARAQLRDFDAVYSAHIASYGSIPATLAHVPGAVAGVLVTFLTDAQLERMHETEAVGVEYDYVKLSGINLLVNGDMGFTAAYAYISRRGCLNRAGRPVPLATTTTGGRQGEAMTQEEVLAYARNLIAPREDLDHFIRRHIDCAETRTARSDALAENALHHGWLGAKVLRAPY